MVTSATSSVLQPIAESESLPPEAEKGQCNRRCKCEGEKARTEFGARLRSHGLAQPLFQRRRWRRQRQRCGERGRDGFRLSDALCARGAERDVTLDIARRIVVEYPKRIQLRVFAEMFGHERVPSALARSVCNLRIAIEMRLLIVPSGTFSSCAISTWVLFP